MTITVNSRILCQNLQLYVCMMLCSMLCTNTELWGFREVQVETLLDTGLMYLHIVAECRLLALSLRACRVRDVVFCTFIWTRFLFCVSVPTKMLHPRLVVLFSMLACVSAVPASEEQSLIQLYKATQVCGCS